MNESSPECIGESIDDAELDAELEVAKKEYDRRFEASGVYARRFQVLLAHGHLPELEAMTAEAICMVGQREPRLDSIDCQISDFVESERIVSTLEREADIQTLRDLLKYGISRIIDIPNIGPEFVDGLFQGIVRELIAREDLAFLKAQAAVEDQRGIRDWKKRLS